MLKKIINFIVVLAVVVAISGIFIHLYNNSRKVDNDFDVSSESSSNKKSKKKNNSVEESNSEQSNSKSDSSESDDNDVVEDNNSSTEEDNSVTGNEVAVVSTGTKENIYIAIFGGIVVIAGASIILKVNKDGV